MITSETDGIQREYGDTVVGGGCGEVGAEDQETSNGDDWVEEGRMMREVVIRRGRVGSRGCNCETLSVTGFLFAPSFRIRERKDVGS